MSLGFLDHTRVVADQGVVLKTVGAPYAPGDRGLWRNAKALNRQEFVIVGWSDPEGGAEKLWSAPRLSGRIAFPVVALRLTWV
jgi:ATP-dependent DNA ligase